ncbi:MAG: hypothetical protein ACMXYK_05055 [Candidatus Woesearchaeota archaeon]
MKAQIFSLDAVLALGAIIILFAISPGFNNAIPTIPTHTARDITTIIVNEALHQDIITLENFINTLPDNTCAQITIFDNTLTEVYALNKSGCINSTRYVQAWNAFYYDEAYYIIRGRTW